MLKRIFEFLSGLSEGELLALVLAIVFVFVVLPVVVSGLMDVADSASRASSIFGGRH